MKIKVNDLKQFKANAAFIKQNGIIPVLNYLKFEDGTITKNNLNSFLIQKVDFFSEAFLVDEKILMNFLDFTTEPEIEIKLKDNRILITDGKRKVTSPTDEVINFPTNESGEFEKTKFDAEILESIKIASNFILADEPSMPAKCHIFIGKKTIAGSNALIAYLKRFEQELPTVVLAKDTCQTISRFDGIYFSQSENYHFFENDICKYGFIKPTYPFFDLTVFLLPSMDELLAFKVIRDDLVRFNDMAVASTPTRKPIALFRLKSGKMELEMQKNDYEVDISDEIDAEGEMDGEFNFMPANLNQLLKGVPDDKLTFYQSKDKYYITGESGFTSLIMTFVNQN